MRMWQGTDGMMRGPGFVVPEGYTKELALESVGPGWALLVNMLFSFIAHEKKYNNTEVTVIQVKEKFGTLRVYTSVSDVVPSTRTEEGLNHSLDKYYFVGGFVSALERMSSHICEECGKAGQLRGGNWLQTTCDEHARGSRPVDFDEKLNEKLDLKLGS